MLKVFCAL